MAMNVRTLASVLMMVAAGPIDAGQPLSIRVSPSIAIEPANLRVSAILEENDDNRAIEVIAESRDFYRSSESPLDGRRSPRVTTIEFRDVPGGSLEIRVNLKDAAGRTRASALAHATILTSRYREP
jgi:hypothetical protein